MGRSVSTHRHAIATVYLHPEFEEGFESESWDDYLMDLQENVLPEIFPSLTKCDRWQDREDHVIMENGRCEVSVSEYCGLVAVCLAPLDPDSNLDIAWCENVANNFHAKVTKMMGGALQSQGFMSNGGQVFTKVSA